MSNCGLSSGVELHFLRSGIKAAPYKVTAYDNENRYDYARVLLPQEAAEWIDDHHRKREPVNLVVDGEILGRYFIPEDAITIDDPDDEAWLKLLDCRKILEYGQITEYKDKITARDAVEFVLDNSEDKENVIERVRFADDQIGNEISEDYRHVYGEYLQLDDGWDGDIDVWMLRIIESVTGWLEEEGGLDFDNVTPAEALVLVEKEFSVQSWIDRDGTLWMGFPELDPALFVAAPGEVALSEYNVTEMPEQVMAFKVTGGYTHLIKSGNYENDGIPVEANLQSVGVAYIGEYIEEDARVANIERSVFDLQTVENIAARRLRRRIFDERRGNVVINGNLSDPTDGKLQHIKRGDLLALRSSVHPHKACQERFDDGLFLVTGVQHSVDPRDGWRITVEVGQLSTKAIETDSWLFDPRTQSEWDSFEDWKNQVND